MSGGDLMLDHLREEREALRSVSAWATGVIGLRCEAVMAVRALWPGEDPYQAPLGARLEVRVQGAATVVVTSAEAFVSYAGDASYRELWEPWALAALPKVSMIAACAASAERGGYW